MVNKVQLLGRIGKDIEVKSFNDGNKIASFTLATTEKYKDKQGAIVENTDWHNCVVKFTKQAEVAEKYLKKGDLLFIEGKIKYRNYDDKDGNKKYITEIVVERFNMLGGKKDNSEAVSQSNDSETNDGLPF